MKWPEHTGRPRPRRVRMAYGAIAFALLIALGPGAGLSSDAFGAQAAPPRVIRLVSVNLTFRLVVDKAPLGTSKGDTVQTTNVLSNAVAQFGIAKGAVVGSDAGRATNVDAVPMTVDVLVRLPKGTLHVRGRSRAVGQTRVAPVVGGTGQFKGAMGTLTVAPIAHSADSLNTYRLRYP